MNICHITPTHTPHLTYSNHKNSNPNPCIPSHPKSTWKPLQLQAAKPKPTDRSPPNQKLHGGAPDRAPWAVKRARISQPKTFPLQTNGAVEFGVCISAYILRMTFTKKILRAEFFSGNSPFCIAVVTKFNNGGWKTPFLLGPGNFSGASC